MHVLSRQLFQVCEIHTLLSGCSDTTLVGSAIVCADVYMCVYKKRLHAAAHLFVLYPGACRLNWMYFGWLLCEAVVGHDGLSQSMLASFDLHARIVVLVIIQRVGHVFSLFGHLCSTHHNQLGSLCVKNGACNSCFWWDAVERRCGSLPHINQQAMT